jgi:hypothetical protein
MQHSRDTKLGFQILSYRELCQMWTACHGRLVVQNLHRMELWTVTTYGHVNTSIKYVVAGC